jgi:hypothetical protein
MAQPKSAPKNHHYIPQCYLRGFVLDEARPRLYVIDSESRRAFFSNPRNVGSERDFNTYLIDGEPRYDLESAIALFEGELGPVLRDLDQGADFAGNCRIVILNLIAALALRNPRTRATKETFMTELFQIMFSLNLRTRERWECQVKKMQAAGIEVKDVDYELIRDFHQRGEYDIIFPTGYHHRIEFESLDKVLPYLFGRKWTVLRAAPESEGFITSDQPVCLTWTNPSAGLSSPGFGLINTDVFFPVSRQIALLGRFEGPEQVRRADVFDVSACNGIMIQLSRRQVYAATDTFLYRRGPLSALREGRKLIQDIATHRAAS